MQDATVPKRSHIRFEPDPNALAWVSLDTKEFHQDCVALIENESHSGCCLIFNRDFGLKSGAICLIQVGSLDPMSAEVRWIQNVDAAIWKIGFEYLE